MARKPEVLLTAAAIVAVSSAALADGHAQENIAYAYDARGRLVQVTRTGNVNNGALTNYSYDKADNRKAKVTTGAPK
jgi:YD repeat-containing protein